MGYILPTVITLICSSALFTAIKYFSSRTVQSTVTLSEDEKIEKEKKEMQEKKKELLEKWWTPEAKPIDNSIDIGIQSYEITFPLELIQDLRTRLNTRKDPNKNDTDNVMQKILTYWANGYNFERRLEYINKYPHFTTNIQGLNIHYIHVKPKTENKRILPLLMLHDWPSSIMEFYKIIPLLIMSRSEYNFVFEVIVPSLPGFGFSSAPMIPGFSCVDMSVVLKKLMQRLGHDQFYIQGGDWGIFISRIMASLFPEDVLGIHCNMCAVLDKRENLPKYSALAKIKKLITSSNDLLAETKYFQVQAMKPETTGRLIHTRILHNRTKKFIICYKMGRLGYIVYVQNRKLSIFKASCNSAVGLNDSPAPLATYIVEKFLIGTNHVEINNDILKKYSRDELLDNIMIYWKSNSITTAMKIYAEQFSELENELFERLMNSSPLVSCAISHFLSKTPRRSVLRRQYENIINITYAKQNGRFPASEEPELFSNDIYDNIHKMLVTENDIEQIVNK